MTATAPTLDAARIEAFAGRIVDTYTQGMVTLMIDLGHRTGLLAALAEGPGTSQELADRAGLVERYVRECLGCLVTGGIVDYAADSATYTLPAEHAACLTGPGSLNLAPMSQELADRAGLVERYVRECLGCLVTGGIVDYAAESATYTLPAEHAACLTGPGSLNLAPMSQLVALLGRHVSAVARVARDGGGIPYEEFRPDFTDVMDGMSRGFFDGQLIDGVLPLTGELPERLAAGIRVAEIGCGTGHSTNLLARQFPRSTFVGYDISADAIARARAEADEYGLSNVAFEVLDVATLPAEPAVDAVFAFDVVHDQAEPATVLDRVHAALSPGGVFVMFDVRAASRLEDNIGNPVAPLLYATSTLHCMTVSLACGGAGLGTVWGEELALRMLGDAGFADVTVHEVPDDPMDSLYLAHKR